MNSRNTYSPRQSPRLAGYDYAQAGTYFVTLCTHNRANLFGEIVGEHFQPSADGAIVIRSWNALPEQYPGVELDAFVLMPNHIHGILVLPPGARSRNLSDYVRGFKARVTRELRLLAGDAKAVWQSGFHDRVVRDEDELHRVRQYILENPLKWSLDPENPAAAKI